MWSKVGLSMNEQLKEEDKKNPALLYFVECYCWSMWAIIKPR